VALAHRGPEGSRGWLVEEINGGRAAADPAAAFLLEAGFNVTAMGLQLRTSRGLRPHTKAVSASTDSTEDE
jgi:hypothetical protein